MLTKNNLKFLEKLIALETITGSNKVQKKAITLIEKELPKSFKKINFLSNNYPSVLFYSKEKDKFDVLFVVHIDVVSAKKELFKFKKIGDKIYGRGVYDMKGPILSCLIAINNYFDKNSDLSIGLIVTSDEERGGFDGTGTIIKKTKLKAKIAIVPDGGKNLNSLIIEEKGVLDLSLSCKGVSVHVAEPWKGENAVLKMMSVIDKIMKEFSTGKEDKWGTTVSPVHFDSSFIAQNVIPDTANCRLIFRYTKDNSLEDILNFIKNIDKDIKIKINVQGDPLSVNSKDKFLQLYRSIIVLKTKKKCVFEKYHSACDARFLSSIGTPVIITRPVGGGAHSDKEWVSEKSLVLFSEILTDFINKA